MRLPGTHFYSHFKIECFARKCIICFQMSLAESKQSLDILLDTFSSFFHAGQKTRKTRIWQALFRPWKKINQSKFSLQFDMDFKTAPISSLLPLWWCFWQRSTTTNSQSVLVAAVFSTTLIRDQPTVFEYFSELLQRHRLSPTRIEAQEKNI